MFKTLYLILHFRLYTNTDVIGWKLLEPWGLSSRSGWGYGPWLCDNAKAAINHARSRWNHALVLKARSWPFDLQWFCLGLVTWSLPELLSIPQLQRAGGMLSDVAKNWEDIRSQHGYDHWRGSLRPKNSLNWPRIGVCRLLKPFTKSSRERYPLEAITTWWAMNLKEENESK